MKIKEFIKFIPFLFAVILTLTTIVQVILIPNTINEKWETVRYLVSDSVIYAGFGLIIVLIFILQGKNYWKHAFAILLIISMTPLIQFINQKIHFGIGFLQVECTASILLIIHLILNKQVLKDAIKLFRKSETDTKKEESSMILFFENKFNSKNMKELEEIFENKELVPEAVEAARRLIEKNKNPR